MDYFNGADVDFPAVIVVDVQFLKKESAIP